MSWTDSPILFKTAAIIYGVSVPGHVFLGFDAVYPALRKIPRIGKDAVGQRGAESTWNYVTAGLTVTALLNWQWARTGGPQTVEESIIFWTITGIHAINGFRYVQVGLYPPLAPMWLAPAVSLLAWRSA